MLLLQGPYDFLQNQHEKALSACLGPQHSQYFRLKNLSARNFWFNNIKIDDNDLNQIPKCKYLGSIITEYEEKEYIIQRIKEATVMFNLLAPE